MCFSGLSAAVLAGGRSRRFGRNKCEVMFGEKSLLEWALSYARRYSDRLFLVTKAQMLQDYGVTVLHDRCKNVTPMSGIITVTPFVDSWLLLLSCDTILASPSMLDLLFERRQAGKAVFFRIEGRLQPFPALYPRGLLSRWEEAFVRSDYRLSSVVTDMPRVEIDEEALSDAGFNSPLLWNINTPASLSEAKIMLLSSHD
jgi:molybdopterin-guanine dinucleotide biosynthesis protein A